MASDKPGSADYEAGYIKAVSTARALRDLVLARGEQDTYRWVSIEYRDGVGHYVTLSPGLPKMKWELAYTVEAFLIKA